MTEPSPKRRPVSKAPSMDWHDEGSILRAKRARASGKIIRQDWFDRCDFVSVPADRLGIVRIQTVEEFHQKK